MAAHTLCAREWYNKFRDSMDMLRSLHGTCVWAAELLRSAATRELENYGSRKYRRKQSRWVSQVHNRMSLGTKSAARVIRQDPIGQYQLHVPKQHNKARYS